MTEVSLFLPLIMAGSDSPLSDLKLVVTDKEPIQQFQGQLLNSQVLQVQHP
jgi:hypothetical protein